MSQSRIAPRKSSPCCIGCIVVAVIGIGIVAALGIFGYRFVKENMEFVSVVNIVDPPLDATAETLFPPKVGEFERVALNDPGTAIPGMGDNNTSGIFTAKYEDPQKHQITTIAVPTKVAQEQRSQDFGVLTASRGGANDTGVGISMKNPVDGNSTTLTWSKPNWTFVIYTTSTVATNFAKVYQPAGAEEADNNDAVPTPEDSDDLSTGSADVTAAEPVVDSSQTTGL